MGLDLLPRGIRKKYRFDERHHAVAIMAADFQVELADIIECLTRFRLRKSHILAAGGGRSQISATLDSFLQLERGWAKKKFDIQRVVDGLPSPMPTHEIDNFKNRIGVEVEWNNKTEFYDRDLNNFRLLWELGVISVGVIITRQSELQTLFDELGKGPSYGASTTHWNKLIPKVDGGGAGGCPLLLEPDGGQKIFAARKEINC